jgi:SMC interacting uncharacterized protein involved in chromosome segregation
MTNNEMLQKMREYEEEIKKLKNEVNVKMAEADALMGKFLGLEAGTTNVSMVEVLNRVYNKIHD